MPNASIYQLTQIGMETVPGTAVAATKRLTTLTIEPTIKTEIDTWRPTGYKFTTVAAQSKEWTEYSISGPVTYNEVLYLLNSLIKKVTPGGGGANKSSVFAPNSTGSDVRQTFTIENGSADRARQSTYGIVSGLELSFSRNEVTCKGTMLAKAITDAFVMTTLTSANEIAVVPVLPTQGSIKLADTQAGLTAASALAGAYAVTWALNGLTGPTWPINADKSFGALVDLVPATEGSLRMEVNAEGMGLLANLRNGATKFARINYLGDVLGTGNYQLQIDVAMKVKDVKSFSDEDGVYAVEWGWEIVHDSVWGKGTEITVVTALAAL